MKCLVALTIGVIYFVFSVVTKSDVDFIIANVWFAASAILGAEK